MAKRDYDARTLRYVARELRRDAAAAAEGVRLLKKLGMPFNGHSLLQISLHGLASEFNIEASEIERKAKGK